MNILYLYSELGPYNIPVLKCLVDDYGAEIDVIHWDLKKLKPYSPPKMPHVRFHKRSTLTSGEILHLAQLLKPSLAYIVGWMDKGYFPAAQFLKSRGVPVVAGFDDQWRGTLRQWAGKLLFRLYYQQFFSHAWVAGPLQFEFAKRIGFKNQHIIFDMLSCDYKRFAQSSILLESKRYAYPKSFLYVGNFRYVKGTDLLIDAYKQYVSRTKDPWKLICIGCGELRSLFKPDSNIEVLDFLHQKDLIDFCGKAGAFVLPSRQEQWGLVVHEFGAAGLPLLLSDAVGARPLFFIEGFNGIGFKANSVESLAQAMLKMTNKSVTELLVMGENSAKLSSRITPEISAASLISLIQD